MPSMILLNQMKNFFKQNNKGRKVLSIAKGYTIIETMVSVSLFLVIVMAGMGALLNANLLHQKSKDMRSIMDNLSFIMEDISRNLRVGYDYHCIDDNNSSLSDFTPRSCIDGGWGISFKSAPPTSQWVYYVGTNNGLEGIFKSVDGATSFIPLNPEEVEINLATSFFSVSGAEPLPNAEQPFVTIKLVGKIILKNIETPFSLQTSVSQRVIDI